MKFARKLLVMLLCVALVSGVAGCGSAETEKAGAQGKSSTEKWPLSAFMMFDESNPAEEVGTNDALQIGETADGEVFSFIRIDLGATWISGEITDAKLFLKPEGAAPQNSLRVGVITGGWDCGFATREEVMPLIDAGGMERLSITDEDGGWISVPLTDIVNAYWYSGALKNNGVAVFAGEGEEVYTFSSDEETAPYILATGVVGERELNYGKFGYKEMRTESDSEIVGNCFSYALRDENAIENDDLLNDAGNSMQDVAKCYEETGLDGLLEFYTNLALEYVGKHADGLKISQIRPIEQFDSQIDPEKEYRIAMRLGVSAIDGVVDFEDEYADAFDYHFWAELNDGCWAQKFPTGYSQIVPCTGPGLNPGKFPWDSSYFWTSKSHDYYTSDTAYFAVTKDTDEFTAHKGGK